MTAHYHVYIVDLKPGVLFMYVMPVAYRSHMISTNTVVMRL
jgi:hypothetical protein